jgi:hypothetical protein
MKTYVTVENVEDIKRALKEMGEESKKEIAKEVYATALDVKNQAKLNLKALRAWDEGNLANSILAEKIEDGLAAEIGPEAPYGPYVEYGTKPHFPPLDALKGWAKRHGFKSAWPICKKIAEKGLAARPFLSPAWFSMEKEFYKRIEKIVNNMKLRWL